MSSTDAEVMSTEPSAQTVLTKTTSEDTKNADGGTVIQPTGDAPPTTNGESTEKSDEKSEANVPIEVSMEEEPKEDFDSVPADAKKIEAGEVKKKIPLPAEEEEIKVTQVEISKSDGTVAKTSEKLEHGGWKLLVDPKKQEEHSVETVAEQEPERMEVGANEDEEAKEIKAAEPEKIDNGAIQKSSEAAKIAEESKEGGGKGKIPEVRESLEAVKPVETVTDQKTVQSEATAEKEVAKAEISDEPKKVIEQEKGKKPTATEPKQEIKVENVPTSKNVESCGKDSKCKKAAKKLENPGKDEEEKMEVDEEVKVDDEVAEGASKVDAGEKQRKGREDVAVVEATQKKDDVKHVPPKCMAQDVKASPSLNKEEQVGSEDNEKETRECGKVEGDGKAAEENEKGAEGNGKTAGENEKSAEGAEKAEGSEKTEEVKSPSTGCRGRGRGRGRGSRSSARTSVAKSQPEVPAEGIANTRPRRSTRSAVDYANPDVATVVAEQEDLENELQQKVTRGRGRGRGRGGHRAGKRSADDDEDAEDSGSEYGGPSKKKKARGSTSSSRGRGRGRGRGGRTRSARGKKKDKDENDSDDDDDEEEMDLGDDDAPSEGSAEEAYKPSPSKRRSDPGQSAKPSPKKRGRRAAGSKAAEDD